MHRLTKEIVYWDHRANQLRLQEEAGKQPRMNSQLAQRRADDLQERLERRMRELEEEERLSQRPPVLVGSALIVPAGLTCSLSGDTQQDEIACMCDAAGELTARATVRIPGASFAARAQVPEACFAARAQVPEACFAARAQVERLAMEAVMRLERSLGFEPRNVIACMRVSGRRQGGL